MFSGNFIPLKLFVKYGRFSELFKDGNYTLEEIRQNNPRLGDVICDGLILRRKTDGICSFRLWTPYLKALNIPPGILKKLRKVAMGFLNELLTDEDLLDSSFASRRNETVSVILVVLVGELIVLVNRLQS
ncbi:hypothetical protein N5P37_010380 [Trichoderma harzianum]|nr:hypothetical protein N5P37_010380 [Trichoderma harzianum]